MVRIRSPVEVRVAHQDLPVGVVDAPQQHHLQRRSSRHHGLHGGGELLEGALDLKT